MAIVQGIWNAQFSELKDLFASKLAASDELGASLVVNVNSKLYRTD